MLSIRFRGWRDGGTAQVCMDQCQDDGHNNARITVGIALPPRTDLYNHSPTGFEWGYSGSGPAQLALALLSAATGGTQVALDLHQEFKTEVVARMPAERWELHQLDVLLWVVDRLERAAKQVAAEESGESVDLSPEADPRNGRG